LELALPPTMDYNCDFEFHVISVDAQCITTVIMNVIARGECALAPKKNWWHFTFKIQI
jgi:hypothetical protein